MDQEQLCDLVASATGETHCTVHCRGFSLADPLDVDFDPEPFLDWDEVDVERYTQLMPC